MRKQCNVKDFLLNNFLGIYAVAVLMLWMKTYIAQTTQFELGVEGPLQQFLLLLKGRAYFFASITQQQYPTVSG